MAKSYKALYEELKAQLEAQPQSQSQEQSQPITEEEIFALKAVAHGCNTNQKLQTINGSAKFLDRKTNKTVSFEEALITVYELIERLKGETDEGDK